MVFGNSLNYITKKGQNIVLEKLSSILFEKRVTHVL